MSGGGNVEGTGVLRMHSICHCRSNSNNITSTCIMLIALEGIDLYQTVLKQQNNKLHCDKYHTDVL